MSHQEDNNQLSNESQNQVIPDIEEHENEPKLECE
jgi:hypothetical protein